MSNSTDPVLGVDVDRYGFKLAPLDPDTLSPGIRDLVVALRTAGLFTTDSGDGSNFAAGMTCAVPYAHVMILCPPGKESETVTEVERVMDDQPGLVDWTPDVMACDPIEGELGVVMVCDADNLDNPEHMRMVARAVPEGHRRQALDLVNAARAVLSGISDRETFATNYAWTQMRDLAKSSDEFEVAFVMAFCEHVLAGGGFVVPTHEGDES